MDALPDHRLDLGALVLQGEIAVPGGVRPPETGDFAAHPDVSIGILHRPLQGGGQFGDGEFGRVDKGLSCGHLGPSIRAFRASAQGKDFGCARQSRLANSYTLLHRELYITEILGERSWRNGWYS